MVAVLIAAECAYIFSQAAQPALEALARGHPKSKVEDADLPHCHCAFKARENLVNTGVSSSRIRRDPSRQAAFGVRFIQVDLTCLKSQSKLIQEYSFCLLTSCEVICLQ
jgi:hypothetical protein